MLRPVLMTHSITGACRRTGSSCGPTWKATASRILYRASFTRNAMWGWMSELSQITATEADAFHKKYYVPSNMVIAVAGDVKAEEVMPVLEKYFGAIPTGPKPEEMSTVEPPQT